MNRSPALTATAGAATVGQFKLTDRLCFRPLDLVCLLTLLQMVYLTFAAQSVFLYGVLLKLWLLALVWPAFRRSFVLWLSIVALWTPPLIWQWCNHEDHVYFSVYWCAALALAFWPASATTRIDGAEAARFLRHSARLLIGLCFLFAALWKLVSPEFTSDALFHYKLLLDDRFSESLARWPGGMAPAVLLGNYAAVESLTAAGSTIDQVQLVYSPRISWLARGMTWWTVAIEGFLALAFLWPVARRLYWIRNASLILFAVSTYLVAPVMGYGFTLMIMGLANCQPDERKTRWAFVIALAGLISILLFRDHWFPADIRDR